MGSKVVNETGKKIFKGKSIFTKLREARLNEYFVNIISIQNQFMNDKSFGQIQCGKKILRYFCWILKQEFLSTS